MSSTSSLVSSAQELLKTRSIPELRDLVQTLEKDAVSKVTELQAMVGSKYHDFIQSADAIAKMQGKSEYLEGNINGFVTLAEDVATHTKELLSRTAVDTKPSTQANHAKASGAGHGRTTGLLPLDGSSVWNCLEDCDIYSAAAVVVQSQVVLDVSLMSMHRNNSKDQLPSSRGNNISSFLSPNLIDDLTILVKNSTTGSSSPALTTGCASAAFLSQTVLDDARLLLLEGSCSSLEKARSLAGYGLLIGTSTNTATTSEQGGSTGFLTRADLLALYLSSADVLLDAAIDTSTPSQSQGGAHKGQGLAAQKSHSSSARSGEQLVAAVRILQMAIVDAHVLFFKPTTLDVPMGTLATSSVAVPAVIEGLVTRYQIEFLRDTERALTHMVTAAKSTATSSNITTTVSVSWARSTTTPAATHYDVAAGAFLAATRVGGSTGGASSTSTGSSATTSEVRKVFDNWLNKAIHRLREWSQAALAGMRSALEVARLQQRVWSAATLALAHPPSPPQGLGQGLGQEEGSGMGVGSEYTQVDWEEACTELLATVKQRHHQRQRLAATAASSDGSGSASAGHGGINPGSMLWSRVFRQPFMLQVERLLRESCNEVLGGARALLLHALSSEGVYLDGSTLVATTLPAKNNQGAGVGAGDAPSDSEYDLSTMASVLSSQSSLCHVPSPRLFRRAETVRQYMQDELADLLHDVVLPVQEGDPEASQGLARALYVQCSQLVGHLAVLLRSIVTSLTTALETQARLALTREKNMGLLLRGSAGGGGVASSGPLLSGLLLVGRLAWLLKIRGRFVEEALSPSLTGSTAGVGVGIGAGNPSAHTAHDHSNGSHLSAAVNNYDSAAANNHNSGLYISEDQMRSAFEIADTNGDGVLTYAEAIDAIQALTVTDYAAEATTSKSHSSSSHASAIPFLSPRLTPSLNYQEFALLCAHMLSTETCSPVIRFRVCMDELLTSAHRMYADRALVPLSLQLTGALEREFGLSVVGSHGSRGADNSPHGHKGVSTFKASWRRQGVDLDGGEREEVSVPAACCAALSAYFFCVTHMAAVSVLSIDTVQELPGADVYPSLESRSLAASSNSLSVTTIVPPGSGSTTVNRLALFASSILFTKSIETAAQRYTELLQAPMTSSTSTYESNGSPFTASEEDVALQACFDLLVCEALSARLSGALTMLNSASSTPGNAQGLGLTSSRLLKTTLAGWKARLDPINASILLPLLHTAAARFVATNHLLLPCLAMGPVSQVDHTVGAEVSAISGVFPSSQPSRFALLPLPMSTHAMSLDTRSKHAKQRVMQLDDDEDDEASAPALRSTTEQLGKSLMSSIGTFLGQSQSNSSTK